MSVEAVNLQSAENQEGRIDVARDLGSSAFAMYVYDLAPGEASCPYHYESHEEWLLVVQGSVVVRRPGGEQALQRGDIARFAAGPDGAHKIMNRSEVPARTLAFSTAEDLSFSVYPDSDKVGSSPTILAPTPFSGVKPRCPTHMERKDGTARTERRSASARQRP